MYYLVGLCCVIQLCTEYAGADGAAVFNKLFYVIRDWDHDDTYGQRQDYFTQIMVIYCVLRL